MCLKLADEWLYFPLLYDIHELVREKENFKLGCKTFELRKKLVIFLRAGL